MNKHLYELDMNLLIKKIGIYLLIAIPFMLVIAVILNIVKSPFWLNVIITFLVAVITELICFVIYFKKRDKLQSQPKDKYDPFKD